jgi:hypothetical protein
VLPEGTDLGFGGQDMPAIVTPLRGVEGNLTAEGVFSVESAEEGLALVGDPAIVEAYEHGEGEVVFIADSSILRNRALEANAPWVVSIIGDGPIRFDEVRHGFEATAPSENPTSLLAALPDDIRNVVFLLLPVVLLGLVVGGRRFGPPEATERTLAPPRRELVDAVAGLLGRMPDGTGAAQPISDRLRTVVARQSGVDHGADDAILLNAAPGIGVDPERLRPALNPRDEEAIIQAQRLLAELSEREHT